MKSMKEISTKAIVSLVKKNLAVAANSTTCVVAYQPKVPEALKKFSKVENDK